MIRCFKNDVMIIESDNIQLMEKLYRLYKIPHYKQKSVEWLRQRNDYLTASTIMAVMSDKNSLGRMNMLANKVSNGEMYKFSGNVATNWGNKYEPVANSVYSHRNNLVIHEFGLIPCLNKKFSILAASPDGITSSGKMLEIKCPYSRVIDGKIKNEYYHQMQQQMAVCDFDKCDFLECKFIELSAEMFWEDFEYNLQHHRVEGFEPEQGVIISFMRGVYDDEGNRDDFELDRVYSPANMYNDKERLHKWYNKHIKLITEETQPDEEELVYVSTVYWRLNVYNCQEVCKDNDWLEDNYDKFKQFWDDVVQYRKIHIDEFKVIEEKFREEKKCVRTPSPTTSESDRKKMLDILNDDKI